MQSLEDGMKSWSTASEKVSTAHPLCLEDLTRGYYNKEVNDDL